MPSYPFIPLTQPVVTDKLAAVPRQTAPHRPRHNKEIPLDIPVSERRDGGWTLHIQRIQRVCVCYSINHMFKYDTEQSNSKQSSCSYLFCHLINQFRQISETRSHSSPDWESWWWQGDTNKPCLLANYCLIHFISLALLIVLGWTEVVCSRLLHASWLFNNLSAWFLVIIMLVFLVICCV